MSACQGVGSWRSRHSSSNPTHLKFRLGIALLGLCALAATAVFIVRSGVGYSGTQLDQDWIELQTWGRGISPGIAQGPNLEEFAQAWNAAQQKGEDATTELARCRELLASGAYTMACEPHASLGVMKLGQQVLDSEGLDSFGLGQVLALARRLQQEGPLINFMVGIHLIRQALKLCRSDATLLPTDLDLPAPQPDELFSAMCRDFAMVPSVIYPTGPGGPSTSFELDPDEKRLMQHMRATYIAMANKYFPLRDHPERFGEIPPPGKPGWFVRLRALLIARPDDMARTLAPLLAINMGSYGITWAQTVSDWKAILGP